MGGNCEKLQLWGGVECTVNRVGEQYFDQLEFSGHSRRAADIDRVAELGIRTLRYPLLWERAERDGALDWRWSDERLARLYALNIEPIAGLVHHGSGPIHTSLVAECFPHKVAAYAAQVAQRYPWLNRYTPVNEPLTTARFSGLYGHWHPHGRDDRTFARALITQCKAIALSMAAIRRVNPKAQLIQTEDMGFTRSTADLRYQADFENERRWLSFDLLAGRVSKTHPLHAYLLGVGIAERELCFFERQPCPPDVIGINYYVTSERFLDSRVDRYPPEVVGGNRRQSYADVEAVRVCADSLIGPGAILAAAHDRYGRPVAVTEAHLGCSAAQQASWLAYVWTAALEARARGTKIEAVTAWALLGAFGWDRLVTAGPISYEPGAFDSSGHVLRPTELATFLRQLSTGDLPKTEPGWWMLDERLLYEPHVASQAA